MLIETVTWKCGTVVLDSTSRRAMVLRIPDRVMVLASSSPTGDAGGDAGGYTGLSDGGNGGCFIATAAYGTPLAEEVRILSQFRDAYLLPNYLGRKLVSLYYKLSPPVAGYIKDNTYLKATVRGMLNPVVWLVKQLFSEDGKEKKERVTTERQKPEPTG